jgi:hypothetical protein
MKNIRYNNAPVPELKIKMINDLLQAKWVNESYLKLKHLRDYGGTYKEIETAWKEYCHFRDLELGLPALVVPHVQGSHSVFRGGK